MPIECREASLDDADVVGALIHAMDAHYIGARAPSTSEAAAMVRRTIAIREGTRFTLAFVEGAPVGVACWVVIRPGHRLSGLVFLKDLFVLESMRGTGVGRALMAALARRAADEGIGRIDLTTDRGNEGARRLYLALGAAEQEKVMLRFDGEVLRRLASAGRDEEP
jgi:GNAT superfamily N-acetyltransferase